MIAKARAAGRDGPTASARSPWPALDVLKFLCVIGMVLAHGFYWTWTRDGAFLLPRENPYFSLFQASMFLGLFPLTLPLLAGATLRLRLPLFPPTLLLQGSVLAALGYLMNVLAAGWYALWAWNVLQLVGVSFLLIGALYARRSVWPVAAIGLLVLISSDPLRELAPALSRDSWTRVLLGDATDFHSWPLFPWFSIVVYGFLLSHWYLRSGGGVVFGWSCAVVGAGLVATALIAGRLLPVFHPVNLIGPAIMQPPAVAVLGVLGVATLLVAGLTALQAHAPLARYGLVRCFSAGILWIYIVHIIVGVRLSRLIFRHVDQYTVVAEPWSGWHPVILFGFLAFLLLLSWLVGYLTLRWLHEKRLRVRVKKVKAAPDRLEAGSANSLANAQ